MFLVIDPNIEPQPDNYLLVLIKSQDEVTIFRCLAGDKTQRLQGLDLENDQVPSWDACLVLGVIIEAKIGLHSPSE